MNSRCENRICGNYELSSLFGRVGWCLTAGFRIARDMWYIYVDVLEAWQYFQAINS